MSGRCDVLIVEDDAWQAELLVLSCQHAGYAAQVAADPLTAIDMIDRQKPQAIVLDVFLGGMNGLALLQELRSHSDLADIPVIICSGSTLELPSEDLALYGVVRQLDKATMQPSDIVTALRTVLL